MKKLFILLLSYIFTPFVIAQYGSYPQYYTPSYQTQNYTPSTVAVPAVPPAHLTVGDQMYNGGLDGLREYLDSELKNESPKNYKILDEKLRSMEKNNTIGYTGFGLTMLLGTIIGTYPLLFEKNNCEVLTSSYDSCTSQRDERINTFLYIGSGVMIASLYFLTLPPKRKDYLNFINLHNKINKKNKMRLNLGFNPGTKSSLALFTMTF